MQDELLQRLKDAIQSPPIDTSVGSEYHRNSFSVEKLQVEHI